MKALGVKQPWAWRIVQGYKDVENRTWLTHYREPFFVHANKDFDRELISRERSRLARRDIIIPDDLPRGGIVGIVTLEDCVRYNDVSRPRRFLSRFLSQQSPCGDQHEGNCYGFKLHDPQPLPFVPWSGKQKFFNVADDLFKLKFEKALVLAREVGNRQEGGNYLRNLGLAYADLGQVNYAKSYLQLAQEAFIEIKSPDAEQMSQILQELESE